MSKLEKQKKKKTKIGKESDILSINVNVYARKNKVNMRKNLHKQSKNICRNTVDMRLTIDRLLHLYRFIVPLSISIYVVSIYLILFYHFKTLFCNLENSQMFFHYTILVYAFIAKVMCQPMVQNV